MHPGRLVVVTGVVVTGTALLLPFATLPVIGTVDGVDGDGWPVMLPIAVTAMMALLGDRTVGHRARSGIPALVAACGALLFASAKAADAMAAVREAGEGASLGVGSWVMLAGTLIVIAGEVATMAVPPR
jgi:hypothetical protein